MDDVDKELLGDIYGHEEDLEKPTEPEKTFEELVVERIEDHKYEADEPFDGKRVPRSILWSELNEKIFPTQAWRIDKLIPKQGHVILASIAGNKKTWKAMEMAKAIASGKNFLGEECFKTEGANVLYINAENSESEMQRRGRQLGLSSPSDLFKLHFCNADDINLNKDEGVIWLKTFVECNKIEVVFVDTFIATAGGLKEEKSEEVRQFFNRFNSLKNKGVAIVWLMHMRKPTNFEGRVPKKEMLLGSQDKSASVEVLLMLHSESGSEEIGVYQRKNRLAVEIEPFKIIMRDQVDGEGRKITTLEYGGPILEQENKKEQAKELIGEILVGGSKTTNQILELTKKAAGMKNTRTALGEMVRDGLVICARIGKQNSYSLAKEELGIEEDGGAIKKDDLDLFGN